MTLKINEVFGPTIQGEGPSAGRHCLFVRLAQCNLHCVWCDTPYTWAFTEHKASLHQKGVQYSTAEEQHELTSDEVYSKLNALWDMKKPTTIVISGGEPMLQQNNLDVLIELLLAKGHRVEIETAGTLVPRRSWAERIHFNVSPKLAHSGNDLKARRNLKALAGLRDVDAAFKFVVSSGNDWDEIHEIINLVEIPSEQVWIMPEGTSVEATMAHAKQIVDYTLNQGWNLTLRNHVLIWGDERGK